MNTVAHSHYYEQSLMAAEEQGITGYYHGKFPELLNLDREYRFQVHVFMLRQHPDYFEPKKTYRIALLGPGTQDFLWGAVWSKEVYTIKEATSDAVMAELALVLNSLPLTTT